MKELGLWYALDPLIILKGRQWLYVAISSTNVTTWQKRHQKLRCDVAQTSLLFIGFCLAWKLADSENS